MPSKPNPVYTVSSVATTAPSWNCSVLRSQPLAGLSVPSGGGPMVQPPSSVSNDVSARVAPSAVTFVSSTQRPSPSVAGSDATEIETSIFLPA